MTKTDVTFLMWLVPMAILAILDIGLISVVIAIWRWVSRR